jgi:23S rRNA A1618 N6-methylase RlmF
LFEKTKKEKGKMKLHDGGQFKLKPHPSSSSSSLSHYEQLHRKNKYFQNPPDLYQLALEFPNLLGQYVHCNHAEKRGRIDWKNAEATKALTITLLLKDFNYQIFLPDNFLCPPIPNRLNYICWLSDLLEGCHTIKTTVNHTVMDVGTGASIIYPLLGIKEFGWDFYGVDIHQKALEVAALNIQNNPVLQTKLRLLLISPSDLLQKFLKENYFPLMGTPQQQSRKSVVGPSAMTTSEEETYESNNSIKDLYLNFLESLFSTNNGSGSGKNEIIAAYRGQLRQSFSAMEDSFQYRLYDCEFSFFQQSQKYHLKPSTSSEVMMDGSSQSNKKSKRHSFMDDDDDEEEEEEEHELQNSGHQHHSSSTITRRKPLLSAVMTNPPFYDIEEQVSFKPSSLLVSVGSIVFTHLILFIRFWQTKRLFALEMT